MTYRPEDVLPHEERCLAIHEPSAERCRLPRGHVDEKHLAAPPMSSREFGKPLVWTDAEQAERRAKLEAELAARHEAPPRVELDAHEQHRRLKQLLFQARAAIFQVRLDLFAGKVPDTFPTDPVLAAVVAFDFALAQLNETPP